MERERLINAEVFEKFIKEKYADGEKAEDIKEQMLFDLSCQPTVYDVDAVVKQLEEMRSLYQRLSELKDRDHMKYIYKIEALNDAIEIVKGGGVDGN